MKPQDKIDVIYQRTARIEEQVNHFVKGLEDVKKDAEIAKKTGWFHSGIFSVGIFGMIWNKFFGGG